MNSTNYPSTMAYTEFEITYLVPWSEFLQSFRIFWWRSYGYPLSLLIAFCSAIGVLFGAFSNLPVVGFAFWIVAGILLLLLLTSLIRRSSYLEGLRHERESDLSSYKFSLDGVHARSGKGNSFFRWISFRSVRHAPGYLFLILENGTALVVRARHLSDPQRQFIRESVRLRRMRRLECPSCSNDRALATESKCPHCGARFDAAMLPLLALVQAERAERTPHVPAVRD